MEVEAYDNSKFQSPSLQKELRRLEKENKALRTEIGQEKFKVQQLQKLQDGAVQAERMAAEARKREAQALRDLEVAKSYVNKRHSFALNEKADLLQQIENLERLLQEAKDREFAMKAELQETLQFTGSAADRQTSFEREAERLRKESTELAAKLKRSDQRLQQLEQKHLDDKAKIKALAERLRVAVDRGFIDGGTGSPTLPFTEVPNKWPAAQKAAKIIDDVPIIVPSKKELSTADAITKRPQPQRLVTSKLQRPTPERLGWADWGCCQRRAAVQGVPAPVSAKSLKKQAVKANNFDSNVSSTESDRQQNAIVGVLMMFIAAMAIVKWCS